MKPFAIVIVLGAAAMSGFAVIFAFQKDVPDTVLYTVLTVVLLAAAVFMMIKFVEDNLLNEIKAHRAKIDQ